MNRRQFLRDAGTTAAGMAAGGMLASQMATAAQETSGTGSPEIPRIRLAIVGFQHSHIWGLVAAVKARPDVEIVAACEEDPVMRDSLLKSGKIKITHSDYRRMLQEVPIDAVAVGEWFGKRGRVAIDCLNRGKAVIADKPLCTTLEDYREIARLAGEKKLPVGLMLTLRDSGLFIRMRELARSGEIGDVREVLVGAEHPLARETRPAWFNEPGKQGGTINDIGVHGFDLIPWVTGLNFRRVIAARGWKTDGVPAKSAFLNGGQAMLELENGAGVNGSFSYVAPDSLGFQEPMYWRLTIFGGRGAIEGGVNYPEVMLYKDGEKKGRGLPPAPSLKHAYLDSFLRELRRQPGATLTTSEVLRATRVSLTAQEAADQPSYRVDL